MPANGAPASASGSSCGVIGLLGSVLQVVPFGWITFTMTRSEAEYPLADTKSRCGKTRMLMGDAGGLLTNPTCASIPVGRMERMAMPAITTAAAPTEYTLRFC